MKKIASTTTQQRPAGGGSRRALTLLELVVVIAVLVVLAGLIVPLVSGLGYQTNAATNATVADDVSRAVRMFHGRSDVYPNGWDSLVNTSGTLFTKLHDTLTPLLQGPHDLTAAQAESLTRAGMYTFYDAVEGSSPNTAHTTTRATAVGGKIVPLSSTLSDVLTEVRAAAQNDSHWNVDNRFVVVGLGPLSSLRGTTIAEIPLIQAADPTNHYARVLSVFMIPRDAAAGDEVFPAVFVCTLMPDGTTRVGNIEKYNNLRND